MKRTVVSILAIAALLVSCSEPENKITRMDGEVTSSLSSDSKSDAQLAKELAEYEKEEAERLKERAANVSSLEFDKVFHDFGDVQPETPNKTSFIVTNTSDKPLIISDVSASCGCTMPKKPSGPIAPGKSDEIEVVFKSKPKQLNEIKKTVTVTANTLEKVHKLEIRAFVK